LPVETLDKFSGMIQSGSTSMRLGKPGIGNFNKIWDKTPNPTGFEWLSRDREVGAKFVADPLTFLALPMVQLGVRGSLYLSGKPNFPTEPYPALFIVGELDPVGGVDSNKRLVGDYQKHGFEDLNLYVYDDGRHEMHNETNKQQVFEDITAWLAERF
jgi:alpha-beta hydrolase superfamily lysophospholipase